jgi:hypothetical protein
MNQEKNIIENIKKCPRFNSCSINVCPLDLEAIFKKNLPGENYCPFTIKKKGKGQKGIRTLSHHSILEFIPESNVKILNKRNQRRWHVLYKNNEKK